jgi:DNA-binding response OmpR family regulator
MSHSNLSEKRCQTQRDNPKQREKVSGTRRNNPIRCQVLKALALAAHNFDKIVWYYLNYELSMRGVFMAEKAVILIVDDEPKILELVASYFAKSSYKTLCAGNGRDAFTLFQQNPVSIVLLDLMLPDLSGEEVCRKIRFRSQVPIIMMTAKVDEESIIKGLNMGADDYVTKPFSPRELVARVEAVLRRTGKISNKQALVCGDLFVDIENRCVSRNGEVLNLTHHEYKLLALLMSRPAKIFTRDEIIEGIKGDDYDGFDRMVDTHIKNLRQKLGDDPKNPSYIITVYGMGYRFALDGN